MNVFFCLFLFVFLCEKKKEEKEINQNKRGPVKIYFYSKGKKALKKRELLNFHLPIRHYWRHIFCHILVRKAWSLRTHRFKHLIFPLSNHHEYIYIYLYTTKKWKKEVMFPNIRTFVSHHESKTWVSTIFPFNFFCLAYYLF